SSEYATIKYSGGNEVIYTPPANFTGDDRFTYVVRDSAGQLATGTVSIAVVATRPVLSIQLGTDTVTMQWPTNFTGYVAEVAAPMVNTNTWITLTKMPGIAGTNYPLTFPPTTRYQVFRLRSP